MKDIKLVQVDKELHSQLKKHFKMNGIFLKHGINFVISKYLEENKPKRRTHILRKKVQ